VTSVDSRGQRNNFVAERFDHYLVVGIGFHGTYVATGDIDPTNPAQRDYGIHNMHLGILYQAGLPALAGVMLILVTAARQQKTLLRHSDQELYMLTLAMVGCFAAVNVTTLFQPIAWDRFFWMPVAITSCLWSIRRAELREAARR
jgi:O-antigen ligase